MVSIGELTGVIPAFLICGCREFLIERGNICAIHIYIELAENRATFIDDAKGLPGEGKCYRHAILRCLPIGTIIGTGCGDCVPAGGIEKGTVLIIECFR